MNMILRTLTWGLTLMCSLSLSLPGICADEKTDGPVYKYFSSGELSSEWTVKDGQENGPARSFYRNGRVQEEWTFKDGKREGPAKDYYDRGELKAAYAYKNNKQEGPVTVYWENGEVMRVGTYKDGQWDGLWKDLGVKGRVESERLFRNGQEEGTSKYYHFNGKLKGEFVYQNGKLQSSQEYYSAGNLSKECDFNNGKVCKEFLEIRPQDFIEQIEKKLSAIQDISYVLSTSFRPQSDENAVWTETLRTGHWYKAPHLAREDSVRLSLPGKPETHWIFKLEDNSLIAYEILKDGEVVKKEYPANAWESVGPPNNLISDFKRRMAGNLRSVSSDDSRKVHSLTFNSPDGCTYEIADDTGLPLMMTLLSSDQDGTKLVRVQMTDIKVNTGMDMDVFRVPEKANAAQAAGPSK